jgi:hypothetical protein
MFSFLLHFSNVGSSFAHARSPASAYCRAMLSNWDAAPPTFPLGSHGGARAVGIDQIMIAKGRWLDQSPY